MKQERSFGLELKKSFFYVFDLTQNIKFPLTHNSISLFFLFSEHFIAKLNVYFICSYRYLSSALLIPRSLWWRNLSLWRRLEGSRMWCPSGWMSSTPMHESRTLYWRWMPLWTWLERTVLWSMYEFCCYTLCLKIKLM